MSPISRIENPTPKDRPSVSWLNL
ncbi:uncharacterized protein METZ01_LOCUS189987, partial [marine metagenome]